MKTISKLALVCSLVLGSATLTAQVARAGAGRRGAVNVSGPSVKAVVVGPAALHAYSAFAGGAVYAVPAVTGTDADCRQGGARATALPADRTVAFSVAAGEVVCLETARTGSFELLWHSDR
jgi:hypothetical protein